MLLLTCSEPAYLRSYTAYVLLMMGETVARNMYSKATAENKNAIVASCWTYFTTILLSVQCMDSFTCEKHVTNETFCLCKINMKFTYIV